MVPTENTTKASEEKQGVSAPAITLPKGGGAIHGMGEKFAANPVTGTGSMSIPIATSPGRSGFGPQLSLSYDSGAGNSSFGLGWNLSLPAITRKTDKGLPKYQDAEESDVFILSGMEDLVPVLNEKEGKWERELIPPRIVEGKTYTIQCYRPRIEGLFARIERWTNQADQTDTFWRSISKDNITTWYGKTEESRIADPSERSRIFSWLICESYDGKGNVIVYQYKSENSENIDLSQANENNRSDITRQANRYLKTIKYGNHTPYFPLLTSDEPWPVLPGDDEWLFEAVFDYGDHDENNPLPREADKQWPVRNDPFSSYRAGFEVRTYRLCQRVLMFHHFPDEENVGQNCLVRSTDFNYSYEKNPNDTQNPVFSLLLAATQTGYKRDSADGYLSKSLPPLEFEYSPVLTPEQLLQQPIRELANESQENLAVGLDGSNYQWVDLDGEGLSGILTEQADGWFYKRNLSANHQAIDPDTKAEYTAAHFSALERVATKPNASLAGGQAQFLDLAGNGQTDLVIMERPVRGFYERTLDEDWEPFRTFSLWPNLDTRDPNLKFIDLTGDGHADILISEDHAFVWHASLAEAGFAPAQRVMQVFDEEKGPRLVFADSTQSIFLADLSGDGLTDLVRIRNGEVCYWPNLGYCRFGSKVTMDNSPWFDHADLYNQRRIRLADIDGSGATDILYLHGDGVRFYFNQSGNSWSPPVALAALPATDNLKSVTVVDLLGNGTACLLWSSPLPGDARRPMHYLDLMGGQKPHLLIKSVNNLGAETRVHYAPSTKFYLQDKQNGKPWITKLPFPVHVVERVETYDHISRNRFVTRYAYHHGYFDGVERELRGFGMVEQWDTEQLAALVGSESFPVGNNITAESHVPPVLTKTWFHTGAYLGREHISDFFAGLLNATGQGVYFREPGLTTAQARELLLPDTVLPPDLTLDEEREACRSLKGAMLRQEVYALDGTDKEPHPYTVTEQNFTIQLLQPKASNGHAVFFTHAREALSFHYERNPADPRIQHALTLEVDTCGNVLKSAAIGYGRRFDAPEPALTPEDRVAQRLIHITVTENTFTFPVINKQDVYRTPLPAEARTYELRKPEQEKSSNGLTLLYRFNDVLGYVIQSGDGQHDVDYEDTLFDKAKQAVANDTDESTKYFRRLIEQVRSLYRKDDLTAILPFRELEPLALPGESYKLAFTPGLLNQVFQRPHPDQPSEALLPNPAAVLVGHAGDQGGYLQSQALTADGRFPNSDADDHWWIPSGQIFFSENPADNAVTELAAAQQSGFLPRRYRDPFAQDTTVSFDRYSLLMIETRDALDNRVTVETNDYRVLQPRLVSDPNRNQTAVVFDTLGRVAGTTVMGKPLPAKVEGDSLTGFVADLTQSQIDGFHDAADPHTSAPALLQNATTRIVYDLYRFQRTQNANPLDPTLWLPPYAVTLARETHVSDLLPGTQSKIQISFSYSDGFGREIQKKIQAEPDKINGVVGPPRWVGSGWTVFNNKGKPVRQYEPFFSATHHYEFGVQLGVSPVLFYDPAERVVVTLHPNHSYEKVVFDPWQQTTYDVNDTVAQRNSQSGDPRTDPDIGGYVKAYFQTQPAGWQTWHQQRISGAKGVHEQKAAEKAAAHADTPTTAHFDALGRPFLTVARNRVVSVGHPLDGTEEQFATRVKLDIEGNQREVIDAKDRIVMRYAYDMLGNRIYQLSMEAGARWMLNDVTGKPIRAWDSRSFTRRMSYDALRRPTDFFVTQNGSERLAERTVYGESQGDANNHRTRVYQVFDGAGIVTSAAYDFKGNLRESRRDFLPDYKNAVDWQQNPAPDGGTFTSHTEYDALNRPLTMTAPDGSVYRPNFNEANLLDKVDVNLRSAATATVFVTDIDYNAKGQRTRIRYANSAETTYQYNAETFRLMQLTTTRAPNLNGLASDIFTNAALVQDLRYIYDPTGNITRIEDAALKTITHDRQVVEPVCSYAYDALYRLIEAQGREHIGQAALQAGLANANFRDHPFVGAAQTNDLQALRNYTEQYEYDAVGNFEALNHQFAGSDWVRGYEYDEVSLIEPSRNSNRLSHTTIGQTTETYTYDLHGNMLSMPHLAAMTWDFEDQLQQVDLGGGGTAYYVYDAAGQRVRKVIERLNGSRQKERIYLGGFEVYREFDGSGDAIALERETLHVMDDQQRITIVETLTIEDSFSLGARARVRARYQLGNHLGSASLELDEVGNMISYEEYHPYGTTSYQAVRNGAEVSAKRYRYTGKERDEETGLCYHGARYYAAWLGRWLATDPSSVSPALSPFFYCSANPVRFSDPSGHAPIDPKAMREYLFGNKEPKITYKGKPQIELGKIQLYKDKGSGIWGDFIVIDGKVGERGKQAVSLAEHPRPSAGMSKTRMNYSVNSSPVLNWELSAANIKTPGDNKLSGQLNRGEITNQQFESRTANNAIASAFEAQSRGIVSPDVFQAGAQKSTPRYPELMARALSEQAEAFPYRSESEVAQAKDDSTVQQIVGGLTFTGIAVAADAIKAKMAEMAMEATHVRVEATNIRAPALDRVRFALPASEEVGVLAEREAVRDAASVAEASVGSTMTAAHVGAVIMSWGSRITSMAPAVIIMPNLNRPET